jgi:hypothetical protein
MGQVAVEVVDPSTREVGAGEAAATATRATTLST